MRRDREVLLETARHIAAPKELGDPPVGQERDPEDVGAQIELLDERREGLLVRRLALDHGCESDPTPSIKTMPDGANQGEDTLEASELAEPPIVRSGGADARSSARPPGAIVERHEVRVVRHDPRGGNAELRERLG